MAYSFSEFPHTNYNDFDLEEIIGLYKKVTSQYDALLDKITVLENRLNDYEHTVQQQLTNYANQAVAPLRAQVTNDLATTKIELNTKFNSLKNDVIETISSEFNNIQAQLAEQTSDFMDSAEEQYNRHVADINRYLEDNRNFVAERIQTSHSIIQRYVDNKYALLLNELENLKEKTQPEYLWNDVYQLFGFNCLEWYNATEITCEDWNNSGITCAEWYIKGKEVFNYNKEKEKIVNPLTGELTELKEVVLQFILECMPQKLTAKQFDKLRLTAEAFDKLMLTASEYDLKGEYNDFKKNTKFGVTTVGAK